MTSLHYAPLRWMLTLMLISLMAMPDAFAQRGRRSDNNNSTPPTNTPAPRADNNGSRGSRGSNSSSDNNDNRRNRDEARPSTPPATVIYPQRGKDGPNSNARNNDNRNNRGSQDGGNRANDNRGTRDNPNYGRSNDHRPNNGVDWGDRNRNNPPRTNHNRVRRPWNPPRFDLYFGYDYSRVRWHRPIWNDRNRSSWRSNYVYKQYVYVEDGWDYNGSELEIRTRIRQETVRSGFSHARITYTITGIDLYRDGYHIGSVNSLPGNFGRLYATLSPSGDIQFDNMTYIIGDPSSGFELINTRYTNSYYIGAARNARAAVLDFRARRAYEVQYSHFISDRYYRDYTMVPLVPEDDEYGFGYTVAGFSYNDDWYYEDNGYRDGVRYRSDTRNRVGTRENVAPSTTNSFRNGNEKSIRTDEGTEVRMRRRVEIVKEN
ncbi:MAG: hypothetical protein JNN12_08035 [Bacteroidetes Order II. Incertae sedis bacterium]|nr:hypothetical protein [Bacteroidetes Order II. bacterium]